MQNANIYVCLDQNWNRDRKPSDTEYYHYIDGKDFLTQFAAETKANGDMKWGVSFHPYTVPLTHAKFWDMSGLDPYYSMMIQNDNMVSFQNLGVVRAFLQSPAMLGPDGKMRPFIITEIGACADQGGDVQAAAICAAYMAAQRNGVQSIIYVSANAGGVNQTFSPEAQDMYNNLTDPAHQQKAMATIGISDWGQVLR